MKNALLFSALALATTGFAAPALAADAAASNTGLTQRVLAQAAEVHPKAIEWRHDIHEHPELGNQETRTAALVAEHLRRLGLEVQTGIATTGVVGILRGGKPGPVVALRADMDALPVKEATGLPYASKVRQTYHGKEVDVMHACGHDAHVAILMATAEVLAGVKNELSGTVKFIFQPAEEGPSDYVYKGDRFFGARQMVQEGVLKSPDVDAVFGLHVIPKIPSGMIAYRSGPLLASGDDLHIEVSGQQTHGATPWSGVDPIVASAQIITGLQGVISRQTNILAAPAVVTVGTIEGGSRHNIIPDKVKMSGTIRTFDPEVQKAVRERVKTTAESIASSAGASAQVEIIENYAPTVNDPALVEKMLPTLRRASGDRVVESPLVTVSEDFSYFAREVPGMYIFLGVAPEGVEPAKAPSNHSPQFMLDDKALAVGIKALSALAVDYLSQAAQLGR
jgi:amidohydrolase